MHRLLCAGLAAFASLSLAADAVPEGPFENSACLDCHEQKHAGLVNDWQQSTHGKKQTLARCTDCHGTRHSGAAARARTDEICIDCHGGKDSPVVHSYSTSKHGVLVRLEQEGSEQRLEPANYRAPGCAYCHLYQGNHDVSASVRTWDALKGSDAAERERVHDANRAVCQDCHAPRYITRLFDNGESMLAIGRLKVREAAGVLEQVEGEFSGEELQDIRKRFETMQSLHLKNVYLGIGHQSPDYQWWHGQPALDGDLLRIKGAVGELRRLRAGGEVRDGGGDEPQKHPAAGSVVVCRVNGGAAELATRTGSRLSVKCSGRQSPRAQAETEGHGYEKTGSRYHRRRRRRAGGGQRGSTAGPEGHVD